MKNVLRVFLALVIVLGIFNIGILIYKENIEKVEYSSVQLDNFIEVNGYKINYKTYGDANSTDLPTIFLHGFNAAANNEWNHIAPYLDASKFYVFIDLPGLGLSERLTDDEKPTMDWQTNMLQKIFAELVPDKQVNLVTVSYSTTQGMLYLKEHADKINKFVAISPLFFNQGGGSFSALGNVPLGIGSGFTFLAMGGGFIGNFLYALGCEQANDFCPTQADIDTRNYNASIIGTTKTFEQYNQYFEEQELEDILRVNSDKITVIVGENDGYVTDISEQLNNLGVNQIYLIKNSGHVPHLSKSAQVAQLINNIYSNI
ncbi:alpha/beta fold hydrolase [Culicoidibacter larvae]|uniref:alpha/beta fold hydrolase n=1 Tax=Culicoidibacter larvae TaxID=2579976 RepID=UPI0014859A55|nr:alpha/beta hydrolase [Culicoidibacter larvae]